MARYSHLPVYKSCYVLTREIFRLQEKLPKNLKFTIGTRLFDSSVKWVQGIIVANGSEEKLTSLRMVGLEIETMWTFLRMLYDFKGISRGEFQIISERLGEVAPQLSAWIKWEKEQLKGAAKNPVTINKKKDS